MASDAVQFQQIRSILAAWQATLLLPLVGLFKDIVVVNPDTNLALLTQPVGTWYTPIALTWLTIYDLPDESFQLQGAGVQFVYSGSSPPEIIQGWMVWLTAGPVYISAFNLPTPVTMGKVDDAVVCYPAVNLPQIQQHS
jgi:hypothetical protein